MKPQRERLVASYAAHLSELTRPQQFLFVVLLTLTTQMTFTRTSFEIMRRQKVVQIPEVALERLEAMESTVREYASGFDDVLRDFLVKQSVSRSTLVYACEMRDNVIDMLQSTDWPEEACPALDRVLYTMTLSDELETDPLDVLIPAFVEIRTSLISELESEDIVRFNRLFQNLWMLQSDIANP